MKTSVSRKFKSRSRSEAHEPASNRTIALVVAAARNGVIGCKGGMPWHVPGDLKTFRRLTIGRPIIMGRKTFESIGRALDGRTNIVITRDTGFRAEGVVVAASLEEALEHAASAVSVDGSIMIVGGGEIYNAALPLADIVHMTEIAAEPVGDTWFPALDPAEWMETERATVAADPRDDFAAVLITYKRTSSAAAP